MIVDSSALIAILLNEPERPALMERMHAAATRIVPSSVVLQVSIVMLSRLGEEGVNAFRSLVQVLALEIVAVTPEHAEIAVDTFRRFGKGRHRAGLNFGDCLSYAVARATREPLLFKGGDFALTDIEAA